MNREGSETVLKPINAPATLVAAADEALDVNMKPRRATDLLFYLIITRAIARHGGDRSKAAKSLGIPTSHFNVKLAVLKEKLKERMA